MACPNKDVSRHLEVALNKKRADHRAWIDIHNPQQTAWAEDYLLKKKPRVFSWQALLYPPSSMSDQERDVREALLEAMKAAWKQHLYREKLKRTKVTITASISSISKKQLDHLRKLKQQKNTIGAVIEQLLEGETVRLREEKAKLKEVQKKHKHEAERAKSTITHLYRELETALKNLAILESITADSTSLDGLTTDQKTNIDNLYHRKLANLNSQLGEAPLSRLLPLPTPLTLNDNDDNSNTDPDDTPTANQFHSEKAPPCPQVTENDVTPEHVEICPRSDTLTPQHEERPPPSASTPEKDLLEDAVVKQEKKMQPHRQKRKANLILPSGETVTVHKSTWKLIVDTPS